MSETIDSLRRQMESAAEALDFERAQQLRDRIASLNGGPAVTDIASAEFTDSMRQKPGAMGLGTGQPQVIPPAGWTPPSKPDFKTAGTSRRRKS